MKLNGKVAVVTGAPTNIGRAVALALANEGADVLIHARSHLDSAQELVGLITSKGRKSALVAGDVADPRFAESLISSCIQHFGRVDILVNNAGKAEGGPFLELPSSHWSKLLEANFLTAVYCSQAAARHMLSAGSGCIINTASIRGNESVGRPGMMAYSAAKAALINFTKTLAIELAPAIRVNAVAPGFTFTSAFDDVPQAQQDAWISKTLIKRWILPEELAEAYVYLATSKVTTGEVLVVDGGYSLKEV